VVTRETLFRRCWGSSSVGDDSLNRAIAGVRRIAAGVGDGSFAVQTVPRTGYRLIEKAEAAAMDHSASAGARSSVSRRAVIGGALAATAAAAAGLLFLDRKKDREFQELIARGTDALDAANPAVDPTQFFRRAAALKPDAAAAQGLLAHALAMRVEFGSSTEVSEAVGEADRAARAALALDPQEPNARVAVGMLQRSMLDFATTEDRLRAILATDPENVNAMRQYWNLLQCVGRSRDGLALVERALTVSPMAASNHFPRAQFLWIAGRNAEADRVIARAMDYWPHHRWVRFARFTIFAFTGRPKAALAMLENSNTRPQDFTPQRVALWRISLEAFDLRTQQAVARAIQANVEAAKRSPQLTGSAVMALSALGDVDAAFEAVSALFVVGRREQAKLNPATAPTVARSTAWRFAPWLFTPPVAPLRTDPRFAALCEEVGLTDYWAKRRIKPDYQLGLA
jgi:tetratricopeptide (TPR) repeat protein